MRWKASYIVIGLLALVHLVVVIPAIQHPDRFRVVDSEQYLDLATNLSNTGHFQGSIYPGIDLLRPPGYPVLLAIIILLFSDAKWVSLMQVILTLANCVILYRIAVDLDHKRAGIAAVLIYLLSANVLFESLKMMTETLASFLMILALWMLIKFWLSQRYRWLMLSGIFIGIGAITRPIIYPLFLIWCISLLFVFMWQQHKITIGKHQILSLLAFLSIGLSIDAAWQARNLYVNHQFTISPVGGTTTQNYIMGRSVAFVYDVSLDEAKQIIASAPDSNTFLIEFVKDHPGPFLAVQARGVLLTVLAISYPTWANMMTGVTISGTGIIADMSFNLSKILEQLGSGDIWMAAGLAALFYDLALFGLAAVGVWKNLIHRRSEATFAAILFALIASAYLIITPLAQGSARFRIPIEPYLALMAGLAFIRQTKTNEPFTR